jgi:hypothetical protein
MQAEDQLQIIKNGVVLADQYQGLKIANKVGTKCRIKCPAHYTTDLVFADDIMLVSDDAISSQK